jgi:hypothetical protein
MAFDERYLGQVRLLLAVLPFVAKEEAFALKGGTAINLFIRDMPRLSVDIDLTYLPIEDRDTSLANVEKAVRRMARSIQLGSPSPRITLARTKPLTRFDVDLDGAIKVEVNPVLRGCLLPPETRAVTSSVEEEFGFAEMPIVSFPDLYAGKICAALDRQHPRDWFDVKLLLDNEGLTRPLVQALLVYLASGNRPIHELLAARWQDMRATFENHFAGMTRDAVALADLELTRDRLLNELAKQLTERDCQFLLSFKRLKPDWTLLGLPNAEKLPALQWKLVNLRKMSKARHSDAADQLEATLDRLRRRA